MNSTVNTDNTGVGYFLLGENTLTVIAIICLILYCLTVMLRHSKTRRSVIASLVLLLYFLFVLAQNSGALIADYKTFIVDTKVLDIDYISARLYDRTFAVLAKCTLLYYTIKLNKNIILFHRNLEY